MSSRKGQGLLERRTLLKDDRMQRSLALLAHLGIVYTRHDAPHHLFSRYVAMQLSFPRFRCFAHDKGLFTLGMMPSIIYLVAMKGAQALRTLGT